MPQVLPAILEHDLSSIQQRIDLVRDMCSEVHLDIMDGDFVPNTTVNDPVALAELHWGNLQVSLHLMIRHPELYIRKWAWPNISTIYVHREAVNSVTGCIELIRSVGKKVGLVINPGTSSYEIVDYLDQIDAVMVMGVEPGFSAQGFNSDVLEKIIYLRQLKPNMPITVDGGVNLATKDMIVKAGTTAVCANSYLFKADNVQTAYNLLQQ